MTNKVIEVHNVTKDYGRGRGIFDISLEINKGEMVGFVGTNGSGKTTTIRTIMGFIKPDYGHSYVEGLESWENASVIDKKIGYVPGEISFPDLKTGITFLHMQAELYGLKDFSFANSLIEKLQLDPSADLSRMSKGMKQKTALVAALMNDPDILVLDEPSTGLDPLMRESFLEIIKDEHKKGKTIFMSSHMFEEVEQTCDRVILINDGKILDVTNMNDVVNRPSSDFKIEFNNNQDYIKFKKFNYRIIRDQEIYNQVTINIDNEKLNLLFEDLKKLNVKFINEVPYTLEKHFVNILKEAS